MRIRDRSLPVATATGIAIAIIVLTVLVIPVPGISESLAGLEEKPSRDTEEGPRHSTLPPRGKTAGIADTHVPVYIGDDVDFNDTNGVRSGSGTASDPYIIAGWSIDGKGVDQCIWIEGTTSHFIIENCTLINATATGKAGIYLDNVQNGQLRNNTCYDNYHGIHLDDCTSITLSNNTCSSNDRNGISFVHSSSITLSNNTCSSNTYHGIILSLFHVVI